MVTRIIRVVVFLLLGILSGFIGLSLFFSDLGPGETIVTWFIIAGVLFFFSGLIIGYFNAEMWLLSGIAGWGGTIVGLTGLLIGENSLGAFLTLLLSLGIALMGGFLGAIILKRRISHQKQ